MKYILSIDQGTTGTTACLIDSETFLFIGNRFMDLEHQLLSPLSKILYKYSFELYFHFSLYTKFEHLIMSVLKHKIGFNNT